MHQIPGKIKLAPKKLSIWQKKKEVVKKGGEKRWEEGIS